MAPQNKKPEIEPNAQRDVYDIDSLLADIAMHGATPVPPQDEYTIAGVKAQPPTTMTQEEFMRESAAREGIYDGDDQTYNH